MNLTQKFNDNKFLIASYNKGKINEIISLFTQTNIKFTTAEAENIAAPKENASSFEGNAKIKAINAFKKTNIISIADDSGLVINSLPNILGVKSARWVKKNGGLTEAIKTINKLLEPHKDHSAYFFCSICIAWSETKVEFFNGKLKGTICNPGRGEMGFGFDPYFIPLNYTKSLAELHTKEKNNISHRGIALSKLYQRII